jgi:hypothetical protein
MKSTSVATAQVNDVCYIDGPFLGAYRVRMCSVAHLPHDKSLIMCMLSLYPLWFFPETDTIGLHRMSNNSHMDVAISLHLYSPPYTVRYYS